MFFGAFDASAQTKSLQYPIDLVAGTEGTLYIADRKLPGIWKVKNGKLKVFFQASKKFRTPLNAIRSLAIDQKGQLLAGDSGTREIYRFDEERKPQPLTSGGIGIPMGIAVAGDGTIYVSDREVEQIWEVSATGGKPEKFVEVDSPEGLAIDKDGYLWVVSHGKIQLQRISPEGDIQPLVKNRPFRYPHRVVLDSQKNAYVCDGYAKAIWKVSGGGQSEKFVDGKPLEHPNGLTWDGEKFLVIDSRTKSLHAIKPDGRMVSISLMFED